MSDAPVSVSELQPGMVLARPVLDDNGRTVMQAGSRLTPMTIKRLQKWNVETVRIAGEDTAAELTGQPLDEGKVLLRSANDEDREFMRTVAREAQERFANVEENPVMVELRRLAIRHLVLAGRGALPGHG